MNSFLFRKYVPNRQVVHYKWRGVVFKTRFKANISVKHCVHYFWYCIVVLNIGSPLRDDAIHEFSSSFTAFYNQISICRRNDYQGIKPTWSENLSYALPLRFTFFDLFQTTDHLFVSFIFINSASIQKSSPCLMFCTANGLK
jgi:hypothetical protein